MIREETVLQQTQRRMSIRNVAMTYGIPARTVSRAVAMGELPAILTVTETGRERAYISREDAQRWFDMLSLSSEKARA
jgi:hypothetical protein